MKRLQDIFPRIDRNPLTYRTLAYVLLCTTAFAVLSTAVQLYVEYRRDVTNLNDNIELIEESYLPPISASVYKVDTDGLMLQLNGALKLSDIVSLKVDEQRGNTLIETSVGALDAKNLISREYQLIYSDPSIAPRDIGTLTVYASLDGVYQRLLSRVFTVLATNTVKTFLASAGILAIMYWLITRHLIQISEYTRTLLPGNQDSRLTLHRAPPASSKKDELDQLVDSINAFQDRLREDGVRRKAYEERLRQAEQKYRTVADFTSDWEYWSDVDDSFVYLSPSCEPITGYKPEEFIANPAFVRQIIVAEDQQIWDQHRLDSHRGKSSSEIQFRIRRKDGRIRWIEHSCRRVSDDRGTPLGIRASNRDITSRKLIEIQLRNALTDIEQLKNQLEAETSYLQTEIKLEHNFENIIGNSPALKYVLYKVEQVSAGDTTVLVLGESGTGKELIARAIHNRSPRGARPLIKVNCATLPADLIESELFGHERGAFTGAQNRQLGRFEIADGTSIFLDEVGEMPLELQAKLLRVLQEGEFERIGSARTIIANVRVIAASNRNLEQEVDAGRFREDLFYRLNVFPITVPPLRQRLEDIPLLARHFVDSASKRLGKSIDHIPESVVRKLQGYSWPGNVRELINVLERAVINSPGDKLQLSEDLDDRDTGDTPLDLRPLQEIEREHILKVLKSTGWRIEGPRGAALVLDLNPSTLRSRMRRLNIRKP